jgi:hypothetical protein
MLISCDVVLHINLAQLHYEDTRDGGQRLRYNHCIMNTPGLVLSGAHVLWHASHNLRESILNLWLARQKASSLVLSGAHVLGHASHNLHESLLKASSLVLSGAQYYLVPMYSGTPAIISVNQY